MKQENKEYSERLLSYGYSQEEVDEIITFRDNCEHMPFEMFTVLFQQGVLKRTVKLKKPRNLYVCNDGKVYYLNHRNKRFEVVAYFKDEE